MKSRKRQPSLFESPHLELEMKTQERANLEKEWKRISRKTAGGLVAEKGRKEFRPLDTRRCLHVILKSKKAVGELSFLHSRNRETIDYIARENAMSYGIELQDMVNVGNHLHLKIRFGRKTDAQNFLRVFAAFVARHVTRSKRGRPFGQFWDGRAYTRVVTSRKEELQLRGYLEANRIEAHHSNAEREKWLADFNSWVASL